jgi:lipoate-protein ligase A
MINIINDSQDPYFNLALEEYVFKNMDRSEKYCILWQNSPAVIIGRHQSTAGEINEEFIHAQGIKVVRRLSGGGAVYHDLGNLNFTFVLPQPALPALDFTQFTRPVIKALAWLGVEARNEGRNDITINGLKISGNAQYRDQGTLLHHGTILFAVDLEKMEKSLAAGYDKFQSHGVNSIRSRVTNIVEHLKVAISLTEFKAVLLRTMQEEEPITDYYLSSHDIKQVNQLVASKYSTWEWNYGTSPGYSLQLGKRFAWGKVEMNLGMTKGLVTSCSIRGDFFALRDIIELEQHFLSIPYSTEAMIAALDYINVGDYIAGAKKQDLIELLRQ